MSEAELKVWQVKSTPVHSTGSLRVADDFGLVDFRGGDVPAAQWRVHVLESAGGVPTLAKFENVQTGLFLQFSGPGADAGKDHEWFSLDCLGSEESSRGNDNRFSIEVLGTGVWGKRLKLKSLITGAPKDWHSFVAVAPRKPDVVGRGVGAAKRKDFQSQSDGRSAYVCCGIEGLIPAPEIVLEGKEVDLTPPTATVLLNGDWFLDFATLRVKLESSATGVLTTVDSSAEEKDSEANCLWTEHMLGETDDGHAIVAYKNKCSEKFLRMTRDYYCEEDDADAEFVVDCNGTDALMAECRFELTFALGQWQLKNQLYADELHCFVAVNPGCGLSMALECGVQVFADTDTFRTKFHKPKHDPSVADNLKSSEVITLATTVAGDDTHHLAHATDDQVHGHEDNGIQAQWHSQPTEHSDGSTTLTLCSNHTGKFLRVVQTADGGHVLDASGESGGEGTVFKVHRHADGDCRVKLEPLALSGTHVAVNGSEVSLVKDDAVAEDDYCWLLPLK